MCKTIILDLAFISKQTYLLDEVDTLDVADIEEDVDNKFEVEQLKER